MIKLCVFDVDGTLVTKGTRKIPASCIHALKELQQQGIKVAIASGRAPFAMEKDLIKQIRFDYFVCSNGAYVETGDHKPLYQFQLTAEETLYLIQMFRNTDNALMFQNADAAHCYHGYKRISHMLEGFLGRLDILIDDRESDTYLQDTLPLAAVAKIEDNEIEKMKMAFPQFVFTPFNPTFYDINGPHNKATGIEHICKAMSCSMDDVICFGDDYNDMEMVQACGIGVAMGDAREALREVADYVTDICSRDGIAKALKHYGMIQEVRNDEIVSE